MSTSTKPTLKDAAKRNPSIVPDRVLEMQKIVKQLQDRGILQPSKYRLEPPLTKPRSGMTAVQHTRSMNRLANSK